MKAYAVIDPHWGDPRPVLETISETAAEAKSKAIRIDALSLYSGASNVCVPPQAGSWESLRRFGYRLSEIELDIRQS